MDSGTAASKLQTEGVCVVPLFDDQELQHYSDLLTDQLMNSPEFKQEYLEKIRQNWFEGKSVDSSDPRLSLGPFGAISLPSSQHNPASRKITALAFKKQCDILTKTNWIDQEFNTIQMLMDRPLMRWKGVKVSHENYHRDICNINVLKKLYKEHNIKQRPERILETSVMIQGYVNLSKAINTFHYVPGTHIIRSSQITEKGFGKIKDETKLKEYKNNTKIIEVPPGYMIMFPQSLVHTIPGGVNKTQMLRQFTGARITKHTEENIYPGFFERLKNFELMHLPSGQLPGIYPRV